MKPNQPKLKPIESQTKPETQMKATEGQTGLSDRIRLDPSVENFLMKMRHRLPELARIGTGKKSEPPHVVSYKLRTLALVQGALDRERIKVNQTKSNHFFCEVRFWICEVQMQGVFARFRVRAKAPGRGGFYFLPNSRHNLLFGA